MKRRTSSLVALASLLIVGGCAAETVDMGPGGGGPEGKADDGRADTPPEFRGLQDLTDLQDSEDVVRGEARRAKLFGGIALGSEIHGEFSGGVRVYGYVMEASRGAVVTATLTTEPELDTRIALYGPYESLEDPGDLLVESEDEGNPETGAPAPLTLEIEENGKYLIVFSSWTPTDGAKYSLSLECDGTDFQCAQPDWDRPCTEGRTYIQGGVVAEDTEWSQCEVVLLERTTVNEGVTLTIKPGVHVKGNFFDGAPPFGGVSLIVQGTLHAAGTAEHPIAFVPFVEEQGWVGLVLNGRENIVRHAYIDRAQVGINLGQMASAQIEDVVVEGFADRQSQFGIQARRDVEATFIRALVKGFQTGLRMENAHHVHVIQSVVRDNQVGVLVRGGNAVSRCPSPVGVRPPPVWRDPIFEHSDIYENDEGIRVEGDEVLVQITKCNIIDNASLGIQIRARQLNPDSFFRDSNIFGNGQPAEGAQVPQLRSFHVDGELDITNNYWGFISDPQLSESWQLQCGGGRNPSGFPPEPIADAGPNLDEVIPEVRDNCYRATR